ncbi:LytR/AlgR family response regulator transcription factor [Spirosoma gilvum]
MAPLTRRQHFYLRLAIVPVAALIASHVVFAQLFPGQPGYQFPWAYFLTVATVMVSCWEVNLAIYDWLDARLPFGVQPTRRLASQFVLGGVATLLTFAVVFPLAQRLYTNHWPALPTILKGVTVCVTLATLVNGGYVGLYILQAFLTERGKKAQLASETRPKESHMPTVSPETQLVTLVIHNGKLRLPVDQIAYFYSTGGLILLVKTDGQQVSTSYSSFAQLTPLLDNRYFFQLNRQFLVAQRAVRAVQDDTNRKLAVLLTPALHKHQPHEDVIVSRYRSPDFKKWLEGSLVS